MTDLIELMKTRRSIRRFQSTPVSREDLQPLLEAFRWAPSAGNVQPVRLYVARNAEKRQQLMATAFGQRFIAEAPVVLVVAVELAEAKRAYGGRGVGLYCIQDAAVATQNLLLAAEATGLAACWVGAFNEQRIADALRLPPTERPVAIVPVGVPAERPMPPRRKHLKELVRYVD